MTPFPISQFATFERTPLESFSTLNVAEPENYWFHSSHSLTAASIQPPNPASSESIPQLVVPASAIVQAPNPSHGTTQVDPRTLIRVQFSLPINQSTLTTSNFQLLGPNGNAVAAIVGSDQSGGVATLTPLSPLQAFTTYTIQITNQLLGHNGAPVTPFTSSFTTGSQAQSSGSFRFNSTQIGNQGGASSVAIGPDGNVYVSDVTGSILRYRIDPLTGLSLGQETLFSQPGAQIVGIAFDPTANPNNLGLWVSYATRAPSSTYNTTYNGVISRLTVPTVGSSTVAVKQDVVIGLPTLPRLNHQPNGLAFGPDGRLYQSVGGLATLGGTPNWDSEETLLSGAVIAIDLRHPAFSSTQPLNVQTAAPVNYNPLATGAPVQLFATGLRNAYDLVWHSNGSLYAALNQNSIYGEYTPSAPGIPAVNALPNEALARVMLGRYYGHPNPTRGEFVLNGGNPTAQVDPWEIGEYPVGVQPDADFNPALLYDIRRLGGNSPNGIAEYTGPGPLNGRLLVAFFAGAKTIHSFALGANGLVTAEAALKNSSGSNLLLSSPLDVAVHPSGRIYVANYGEGTAGAIGGGLWLLDPILDSLGEQENETETDRPVGGPPIRMEAEAMTLQGYTIEAATSASQGHLVRTMTTGIATDIFSGASGSYKIVLAVYDEDDGQGSVQVSLDNREIVTLQLRLDAGPGNSESARRMATIATNMRVERGAQIRIVGLADSGDELARVDYLEFIPIIP